MADGWASWDAPREPRPLLQPVGAQQVRYCPRCIDGTVFELDAAGMSCLSCGYRPGDTISDLELIEMVDRFDLPLPMQEARVLS